MPRLARTLPVAWTAILVLVLTWPMWTSPGYGLARDMVFTPRYPFGPSTFGVGSELPRAVPLDAVLATLTSVVDGQVAFRVLVFAVLFMIGWGASRILPDSPVVARCAAASVALWNPYVVERLALGQWALLSALAGLVWLWPAWQSALRGDRQAWPVVVAGSVFGSLTPTGGVLVTLSAIAAILTKPSRPALPIAALAGLAQIPWLLPSLLGAHAASGDPSGVVAFAARAERPGGVWPTLLAGGGTWSPFIVPESSQTNAGHLVLLFFAVVLALGAVPGARHYPGMLVAALVCLPIAGLVHLPGGESLLRWAIVEIPGAGLLRDGQKWVLPWVVLVIAGTAVAMRTVHAWLVRRAGDFVWIGIGLVVLLPVLLIPDAPARTWAATNPVEYPTDLRQAVSMIDSQGGGAVVTLPLVSYRRFEWGNHLSAADPVARWSSTEVIVSDQLMTSAGALDGESERVRAVATALAGGDPSLELRRLGVRWILQYLDTDPPPTPLPARGLELVHSGPHVRVFEVSGPIVSVPRPVPLWAWAGYVGWLSAGLLGVLMILARRLRRR